MKKLKTAMNIYLVMLGVLCIIALIFMTPYYDLYVYGNSDTYEVYKLFQVFNHGILYAAMLLALLAFIAMALDFGKDNCGLPALVSSWILTIVSLITLVPLDIYMARIVPKYLALDFTILNTEYLPSMTLIYISFILSLVIISLGIFISCISTYYLKNEKRFVYEKE